MSNRVFATIGTAGPRAGCAAPAGCAVFGFLLGIPLTILILLYVSAKW
jgi:hypothetical protein